MGNHFQNSYHFLSCFSWGAALRRSWSFAFITCWNCNWRNPSWFSRLRINSNLILSICFWWSNSVLSWLISEFNSVELIFNSFELGINSVELRVEFNELTINSRRNSTFVLSPLACSRRLYISSSMRIDMVCISVIIILLIQLN